MNLSDRVSKIEEKLKEIAPDKVKIDYIIFFKRGDDNNEYYKIKINNEWKWVNRQELDAHLKKYRDEDGYIIFLPQVLNRTDEI